MGNRDLTGWNGAQEKAKRPPLHVLFIQRNDPDTREAMASVLEQIGFQVTAVSEPDEADDLETSPGVLVFDVDTTGSAACNLLRDLREERQWRGVPAVALVARSHGPESWRLLGECFDKILAKPFAARELAQALWTLGVSRTVAGR